MTVDALSLIRFKMRQMQEAGNQRVALERWFAELPDKPITKAELRPLVESQAHVLYVIESERHMEIAFLESLAKCGK